MPSPRKYILLRLFLHGPVSKDSDSEEVAFLTPSVVCGGLRKVIVFGGSRFSLKGRQFQQALCMLKLRPEFCWTSSFVLFWKIKRLVVSSAFSSDGLAFQFDCCLNNNEACYHLALVTMAK